MFLISMFGSSFKNLEGAAWGGRTTYRKGGSPDRQEIFKTSDSSIFLAFTRFRRAPDRRLVIDVREQASISKPLAFELGGGAAPVAQIAQCLPQFRPVANQKVRGKDKPDNADPFQTVEKVDRAFRGGL